MALGNQVPDKTLLRSVQQRMMRKGVSASRVTATVRNGDVTITGTIDFEHERRAIINAPNGIPGAKRIIDQLRVESRKRN